MKKIKMLGMRKENYITEKILVTLPVNTGKYLSFDIESN